MQVGRRQDAFWLTVYNDNTLQYFQKTEILRFNMLVIN